MGLDPGDGSQGDGAQVEGEHDEVEPVPPLADVRLGPFLPHLLAFSPDETCKKRDSVNKNVNK